MKRKLGMGCWAIGSYWTLDGQSVCYGKTDDNESIKAIEAAYETGIKIFDTAANYGAGLSERLISKALGSKINDCFISTKFGFNVNEETKNVVPYGSDMRTSDVAKHVIKDVEKSLKRLNREYIDCLFFHIWDYDRELSLKVRDVLDQLVDSGKINSYGWSIDDKDLIKLWAEKKACKYAQIELSLANDQKELVKVCEELNLNIFNRSPLAMGFLSGKYSKNSKFNRSDIRSGKWVEDKYKDNSLQVLDAVREILTTDGRTLVQGALAWLWSRSKYNIPVPGIRTVSQAIENAKAIEFGALTKNQFDEISMLLNNQHMN